MGVIGLLEAAPDAIVIVDQGGTIVDVNSRTVELFRYDRSALIGRQIEFLIPERYHATHVGQVASFMQNPVVRPMGAGLELHGRRSDGTEVPVEISLSPSRREGEPLVVVAAIRDVTDRKRIEAELRAAKEDLEGQVAERTIKLARSHEQLRRQHDRTRRILDVAGVMMVSIGADEKVQMINPAGAEILGCPSDEIVGRNWFDSYIPERIREEMRTVFRDLMAGRLTPVHRFENTIVDVNGNERLISWHNTVLEEDGSAIATLSSGADITEQRRAERALAEQASLAQLGKMAAVIAHEIKNPLAAVSGALDVVRDGLPDGDPARQILTDVRARLGGLAATVKDLLDFARPASNDPVPIPVRTLIEGTVKLFSPDPGMAEVDVQVDVESDDLTIVGDVQQLNRVLANLLINAGQAMDGKGRVEITVTAERGGCAIEIRDHGPGIPDGEAERILEPFFTTKIHGTGLGLPTSRRIVESHGGELTIDNAPDGGARARIWFPPGDGESSP